MKIVTQSGVFDKSTYNLEIFIKTIYNNGKVKVVAFSAVVDTENILISSAVRWRFRLHHKSGTWIDIQEWCTVILFQTSRLKRFLIVFMNVSNDRPIQGVRCFHCLLVICQKKGRVCVKKSFL